MGNASSTQDMSDLYNEKNNGSMVPDSLIPESSSDEDDSAEEYEKEYGTLSPFYVSPEDTDSGSIDHVKLRLHINENAADDDYSI